MITEYKHLSRDPQLSSVARNCQICIMQLETLKTGIFKSKEVINVVQCIIIRTIYAVYFSILSFQRHASLISLLTRNCRVHYVL